MAVFFVWKIKRKHGKIDRKILEVMDMSDGMIGIIGTILGTVVGWLLSFIRFGKLSVNIEEVRHENFYDSDEIETEEGREKTWESTTIEVMVRIYNLYDVNRFICDYKICLLDKNNKILEEKNLMDKSTAQSHSYGTVAEDIKVVNVQPHECVDINAFQFFDEYQHLKDTKKILFKYKTADIIKQHKIKRKVDFSDISGTE